MFKHPQLHSFLLAAGMAVSAASYADALSSSDYRAGIDRISADYKAAKVACDQLAGNADYNVAIEKCDALAGDSKEACVAESKATYSKS